MMATLPAIHALDEAPGVVASPERIDAWMRVAKAGDTFLYATRATLPIGSAGKKRMLDLAERELVCLTRPRSKLDPTLFNYTATRTSKPSALTRPVRDVLRAPAAMVIEQEAASVDALLPVLTRFASSGRPCPTDRQLAERAGLARDAIPAVLAAMVEANLIRIVGAPAPTNRRIYIISTGAITGFAK